MKRKLMTTTRVIMLGFFLGAMLGSLLLYLPVSLRQGIRIDYIDSLKTLYTRNGDGWHPNELGYEKYYCDKIEQFLISL